MSPGRMNIPDSMSGTTDSSCISFKSCGSVCASKCTKIVDIDSLLDRINALETASAIHSIERGYWKRIADLTEGYSKDARIQEETEKYTKHMALVDSFVVRIKKRVSHSRVFGRNTDTHERISLY